jgi:hypothetical protein
MGYNGTGVFTAGKCLNELMMLKDLKGGDFSAAKKRSKLGYLEAINSPLNMSVQNQIPTQQGSKKRVVEIRWRQRTIETQVLEEESGTCTSTNFPDFNSELFEVSKYVEYKFALNTEEFKAVCEGRSKFIQDSIELSYDALAKTINRAALTEQATNFGINLRTGSSAASSIDVFPAATGAPNAAALQTLQADFEIENEMVGTPIWIGAGNIYKYWKTLEQACCNDAGINMLDLSNSLGYAPFTDTMMGSVFASANDFMVMEQGSIQFVPFNDYVGEDETSAGSSVARGRITDSKTGITYDIKVLQDDCSDDWVVKMSLHYDIFFQPQLAFQVDDPLYGTNGTLRYTAATT